MVRRPALSGLALFSGLMAVGGFPADTGAQDLERAVKATYVAKFAPFVTWPAQALGTPSAPMSICVQAEEAFAVLIERAVGGQAVAGHPLVVRRVARIDPASGCHIAYLGGSQVQSSAAAVRSVRGAPVLTITDSAESADGGIVQLVITGGRVRFSIDAAQARSGGLNISSKLLALAVRVKK